MTSCTVCMHTFIFIPAKSSPSWAMSWRNLRNGTRKNSLAGTCWTTLPTGSFSAFVQQLDFLYQTHPALWEQDYNSAYFSWLDMGETQPEIFRWRGGQRGHGIDSSAQSLQSGVPLPFRQDCRLSSAAFPSTLPTNPSLPATAALFCCLL